MICPVVGTALAMGVSSVELYSAISGTNVYSGRELTTGERISSGVISLAGMGLSGYSMYKLMKNPGVIGQVEKASGVVETEFEYNMIENPGPLAEIDPSAAGTFSSGKYNIEVLEDSRIFYRGGDSNGSPLGQYFTSEIPESVAKVRIESAVKHQWIDPRTGELTGTSVVDAVYAVEFPAGTTIYKGPAGYQGGIYLGGKEQIFIKAPWENLEGINIISKSPLK